MAAKRHIKTLNIEVFVQKSQLIPLFRQICSTGIHFSGYFDNKSNR